MKNVRETQVRKSVIMDTEEFDYAVKEAFGYDVEVHYNMDGIWYESAGVFCNEIEEEEVKKMLSDYLDVHITSIHIDDCECPGVWICFDRELNLDMDKSYTPREAIPGIIKGEVFYDIHGCGHIADEDSHYPEGETEAIVYDIEGNGYWQNDFPPMKDIPEECIRYGEVPAEEDRDR